MAYEPVARLGRGGMGVVDLAHDQDGNRVALKRLTLHGSASEVLRSRQRLLREADVLRRLHHPNVVRLLDVVEEGDDIVLVMPYLSGGSLAERVAQHGPAPADEVDRLAQRMLSALTEAHAAGIIHRDIKPANVLYDDNAEPFLADFGLAHTWDQTHGLTVTGMVVGTPGFMPPEQARDEPLTPASDIFALGATLLFAATGLGPFGTGDPGLLMVRAASGRVEKVPKTLPKPLRKRLAAMLDPRPERRPTAAALLQAYEAARRAGWPRPGAMSAPPARVTIVAAAAACVAVVAGVVLATGSGGGGEAADEVLSDTIPPEVGEGAPVDPTGPPIDLDDASDLPLVDRLDATIEPPRGSDTYPLPIASVPGMPCPRRVAVTLTLTRPTSTPLRLVVRADDLVVGEGIARADSPTAVAFEPAAGVCRDKAGVRVLVEPTAPLSEPVPYALERYDTL